MRSVILVSVGRDESKRSAFKGFETFLVEFEYLGQKYGIFHKIYF